MMAFEHEGTTAANTAQTIKIKIASQLRLCRER